MEEVIKAFVENVVISEQDGRVDISCKKGLFGVSTPDMERSLNEALAYFQQYYRDGEYANN